MVTGAVVEPIYKQIFGVYISTHRNIMLVAESFKILIKMYGKHVVVYTDYVTWYP
ncbi:MAG: hypothetical protein WA631_02125 [Nitrososphaeraceae archaeon]